MAVEGLSEYVGKAVMIEFADYVRMVGFFGVEPCAEGDKCLLFSTVRQESVFYNVVYAFPESEIVKIASLLEQDDEFNAECDRAFADVDDLGKEMAVVGKLPSAQEVLDAVIEEERVELAEHNAHPTITGNITEAV